MPVIEVGGGSVDQSHQINNNQNRNINNRQSQNNNQQQGGSVIVVSGKVVKEGNNNNSGNGNTNTQPTNGNSNTQPTNGSNNNTTPTNGGNNTQPANGNNQTTNSNGVIINISNSAVYLYNFYGVNPNNGNGNSVIVVNAPNYVPQPKKAKGIVGNFIKQNLQLVGAIKQNPVEVALAKVNLGRATIDELLSNLRDRLNHIHIYERKTDSQYIYSATLEGKKINAHEYLRQTKNTVYYGLNLKTKRFQVNEYININTDKGKVNYSLNLETPKYVIHEYFNGTEANYSYSLDIRKKQTVKVAKVVGNARKEGNKIILTPAERGKRGAVWSNKKVDLTKNFIVKAKLYFGNRPQGADGMAFVIQNSPQGNNALGYGGGGLGYRGITNSVAVEFDTWRNPGEINGNHIGFDINGKGWREVPTSEKAQALPQPLESGKEIPVTIRWNYLGANRGQLQVNIFGNTYTYNVNNIEETFGGKEAYIGFTGATGGEYNLQYVKNLVVKVLS